MAENELFGNNSKEQKEEYSSMKGKISNAQRSQMSSQRTADFIIKANDRIKSLVLDIAEQKSGAGISSKFMQYENDSYAHGSSILKKSSIQSTEFVLRLNSQKGAPFKEARPLVPDLASYENSPKPVEQTLHRSEKKIEFSKTLTKQTVMRYPPAPK